MNNKLRICFKISLVVLKLKTFIIILLFYYNMKFLHSCSFLLFFSTTETTVNIFEIFECIYLIFIFHNLIKYLLQVF